MDNLITEFNIQGKVYCIVTDNASNAVCAVDKLKLRHLPCFVHSLNLVVENIITKIPELEILINEVKKIVTHFRRSTVAKEKLATIQKKLEIA